MDKNRLHEIEECIRNASPLDLAKALQEAELYDKKETRAVIDEIYEEFQNKDSLVSEMIEPVFISVADAIIETFSKRTLIKKGLTASRIINECKYFRYDNIENNSTNIDGYAEWINIEHDLKKNGEKKVYNRAALEDEKRLRKYKQKKFDNNGGRINAVDEYTGEKNIYQYQAHPDARRNIQKYKESHLAEVDHIIPLKRIHDQFKGNYALTETDIKNIANNDTNYALTSARINRGAGASGQGGKLDKTITEFIDEQNEREKEGRDNLGLSDETKKNMLRMEEEAIKALTKDANNAVFKNMIGKGTGNTSEIWKQTSSNAANHSMDYIIGNVILYILKPLYYEIADIYKNGLKEGVGAESVSQAFKIRFGRLKDYVKATAKSFMGDNIMEFVKGFISSLIEGIIGLFVGVFKQIFKLVKEGIRLFVEAGKILWGKNSKNMTSAQKGDAIIKIIGGSVISICGIGIEALLNKIAIPEPWSIIISTMLSGIVSSLFMIVLDRIDLFSVKAEKRRMRIEEIFDERINDIKEAEQAFDTIAMERMRSQKLQFTVIKNNIYEGVERNDIDEINAGLFKLATFMNVDLGYNNQSEFVEKFDDMDIAL
ncbi:MAG: hypothetical protein UIC45_03590 [Paludibacteraceae bacterium]|nr:hypothetical protein [Paludibacteraceae bacterium]